MTPHTQQFYTGADCPVYLKGNATRLDSGVPTKHFLEYLDEDEGVKLVF